MGLILSADLDKESLIGAMNLINPVVAVGVLWAKKGKDWNQLDSYLKLYLYLLLK